MIPVSSRHMWLSTTSEAYHLAWEALRRPPGAVLGAGVGSGYAAVTPPVARDFIEQRADIDEPQRGYLVRVRDTGRLQGFIWATTFTHWVHYFRWDSLATPSGLRRPGAGDGRVLDADGSLAEALQAQPREGDPAVSGVVWPTIAEIALLGALGCGGYLLKLLLETLAAEAPQYRFVVVQATANSIAFYERHGFVRVGAVARYSRRRAGGAAETVGYRHWLATDEELHSSDKPSYMMARAMPPPPRAGAAPPKDSLLARLPSLVPKRLPTIAPGPVPSDLSAASAAVDALAAGAVERAQELLDEAEGRVPPPPPPPGGPASPPPGADVAGGPGGHHGGSAAAAGAPAASAPRPKGGKSRSGARPSKAEAARRAEVAVLEQRRADKAARAKAAAQRRAADRAAGIPPRPRGRPPKNRPPLPPLPVPVGGARQASLPPGFVAPPQPPPLYLALKAQPPPAPTTPPDDVAAPKAVAAAPAAKAKPRAPAKRPRDAPAGGVVAAVVKRLKPGLSGSAAAAAPAAAAQRRARLNARPPRPPGGKTRASTAAAAAAGNPAADAGDEPKPRGLWARVSGWLGAQN